MDRRQLLTWMGAGGLLALLPGRALAATTFSDIDGHTHEPGILWALDAGLIAGYPDGSFAPNEPVTRGQLATILYAYDQQSKETA